MKLEPPSEQDVSQAFGRLTQSTNGRGAEIPIPLTPTRDGVAPSDPPDYAVILDPSPAPRPAFADDRDDQKESGENFGHLSYDVIKGLDVGFGYELKSLEDEARRQAIEWAEKGLPRHDLEPLEPLEVEQVLAKRCVQVFSEWVRKVRTRMEDTIQREVQALGKNVLSLRKTVDSIREDRELLIAALTEGVRSKPPASPGRPIWRLFFPSELGKSWFWALMVLLVLADFVANVPVFMELLPPNEAANAQLKEWDEDASGSLWLLPLRMFAQMVVYPEATILAFSIIVFLVFLSHVAGTSLRTILAIRGTRADAQSAEVHEVRSRPWWPLGLSALGVLLTLSVLYVSRGAIHSLAQNRYQAAEERLRDMNTAIETAASAGDASTVAHITAAREEVRGEVEQRRNRADYAATINGMNLPVLGLNMVLVIAAVVAGYQRHSTNVSIGEEPPKVHVTVTDEREQRILVLRRSLREQREAAMLLASEIETSIGKVQHLLLARPLLEWRGKADRLAAVIPMFRAENARHRAMDPRSIRAFSTPFEIEFPTVDPNVPFAEPASFGTHVREYLALKDRLQDLTPPSVLDDREEEAA